MDTVPASASPPAPLTAEQIAIVKATVPALEAHSVAITTNFYETMLAENPPLANIFSATSQSTGAQPRALAAAVLAWANHIDHPTTLAGAVNRIAHKHASLQVQPDQYPIVGKYLLQAIAHILGAAATPAIIDAWTAAYAVLADILLSQEAALYEAARTRDDGAGWVGWRRFFVMRREYAVAAPGDGNGDADADGIVNLYLAPVDGRPLPSYTPGQYVSLQLYVPTLGCLQSRQYSLSEAPPAARDHYRISVRRDPGDSAAAAMPGIISNLLHRSINVGDEVELSQPQGEFVMEETASTTTGADGLDKEAAPLSPPPVVFMAAGVGATPLLAMLETIASEPGRSIVWLQSAHDRASLPFASEVEAVRAAHADRIVTHVFLTQPDSEPKSAPASGTVPPTVTTGTHLRVSKLLPADQRRLLRTDDARTSYYLCGPRLFMLESRAALLALGIAPEHIHLELFDTGDL